MDTIETVVLMFKVMSARCPTVQIGTTSPPKATAILLLVQPAIGLEIIQAVHTIMEQVIPSIQVHAEDSITTTAMAIRPMFPRGIDGNVNKVLTKII